jgi:hypothetical protein
MRKFVLAALSGAAIVASSVAFADDAKPLVPTPATDDGNTVVCRAVAHEGSVVHQSDCRTKREWDRIRFESQQSVHDWQQRGLGFNPH